MPLKQVNEYWEISFPLMDRKTLAMIIYKKKNFSDLDFQNENKFEITL